jgi:hypothetical protein
MKSKLHLILQIEIGARKQLQKGGQIRGELTPQISFDQIFHG